ncbi:MAG: hypothetical protein MUC99_01105 [Anaerolineae bacterium]|jgi:hypothetical protein|nr:hypothetical protein [Anaerolineae bacterium]
MHRPLVRNLVMNMLGAAFIFPALLERFGLHGQMAVVLEPVLFHLALWGGGALLALTLRLYLPSFSLRWGIPILAVVWGVSVAGSFFGMIFFLGVPATLLMLVPHLGDSNRIGKLITLAIVSEIGALVLFVLAVRPNLGTDDHWVTQGLPTVLVNLACGALYALLVHGLAWAIKQMAGEARQPAFQMS